MPLSQQLVFDPATTDITQEHTIGSYIVSASNEVIDSTDVGGTEGLNVNVLNDLTVDIDGVYNVTTNANPDNIGALVHSRAAAPGDAEQGFRTTGAQANADDIPEANVHGADVNAFLMGYDSANAQFDRLTVLEGKLETLSTQAGFQTAAYANVSVGTSATELDISALANRKKVQIQNLGNKLVYLGFDNSVTTSNGIAIPRGGVYEFEWSDNVDLYAISSNAGQDVRIVEAA